MPLVEWTDDLSVGVAEIDAQHQTLLGMINELNDAMRERRTDQALGGILDGLRAYSHEHFENEERYFVKFRYPHGRGHRRSHRAFIAKVDEFQVAFAEGKSLLSLEVAKFLKDWYVNHIKRQDQAYSAFFLENGLS